MAKKIYIKKAPAKAQTPTDRSQPVAGHKKLMLLFTVVNRDKTEFYVDLISSFEVNMQMVLSAHGTANQQVQELLGLTDSDKSVIISVIRRDCVKSATSALEEKFRTVKNGKGIAYTVPLTSTIGVAIYQFLSNTQGGGVI